ncbi:MAG: hypothetical protein IKQ91_03980 [Oscillospiraceae bacterium]|nr:hypothetical protein [Oscillospiraceae bacterium]
MSKVILIGKPDEALNACLSGMHELQFGYAENEAAVLPDTACVLIMQEQAGSSLQKTVNLLQKRGIPAAVLTSDGSEENQEYLLDLGAAQYFILPMKASLLQKRILALIGSHEGAGTDAGLELLMQIAKDEQPRGAFSVSEADFTKIYRFVLRLQERTEKKAQLVIFRFDTRLKTPVEPGTLEDAFPIVQKCLRKGDIVSMFGQTIMAILMAAEESGGRVAAERIINTYQAYYSGSIFDMKYEMRPISE